MKTIHTVINDQVNSGLTAGELEPGDCFSLTSMPNTVYMVVDLNTTAKLTKDMMVRRGADDPNGENDVPIMLLVSTSKHAGWITRIQPDQAVMRVYGSAEIYLS